MPKSKRASRRLPRDAPQFYQPRVECALLALKDALVGCQMLVKYMSEQQGTDWREMGPMLDAADSDFEKARGWLRGRKTKGARRA